MIRAGVKDMKRCMDSMRDMFVLLSKKDYRMGGENANDHGIRVSFPISSDIPGMPLHEPDKRFMAMPAYLGGRFHAFGIKSYGSNPHNREKGLPRSILMVSMLDADTGVPLAYMSANILSAMRTGATVGIGVKFLGKKSDSTIAIIGPGTTARYSMMSFMEINSEYSRVRINGIDVVDTERFISYCKKNYPQIKEYVICDTIEQACEDADLIFFGTTNAANYEDNPRLKYDWLKSGAVVISASALLVDSEFLGRDDVKLICDNYRMYEDWGTGKPLPTQKNVSTLLGMGIYDAVCEGAVDRSQITNLGEVIRGLSSGRDNDEQIILYAVGGMPIEDVAWAHDCYVRAVQEHIGQELTVWDETKV